MLQIYTGDGKGKTTAALGLALRAAGANKRVSFVQFLKNIPTSELDSLKRYDDLITVKRFGTGKYIIGTPTDKDRDCAAAAFAALVDDVTSRNFDIVIADEICTALYYKLVDKNEVFDLIKNFSQSTELVFTGRGAPDELVDMADIVTEMREIKHCFNDGVQAREGIDF